MQTRKSIQRTWLVRLKNRELYCALCGCIIEARKDMNMDHWVPVSRGGETSEDNCVPSHRWCNTAKADHTPEYWDTHKYRLLADLVHTWTIHKVRFPVTKVYKSIRATR